MSYNSLVRVAHWKLQDNAASTVIVDSAGSLDGTLTSAGNTSAVTTTGPNSWLPAGFAFDATNDYCDFGSDSSLLPASGVGKTYECWVKCRGTGINQIFYLGATSGQPYLALNSTSASRPLLILAANNYQYFSAINSTILDGNWHHIAVVIAGTAQSDIDNCALYLNGSSVTKSGSPIKTVVPNAFQFLRVPRGNSNNPLAVSGMAVHPVLSSGDVAELYAGPEPLNTVAPTLTITTTTWTGTVGTWDSQGNGTLTYAWELRDADDDSVVESGTGSSPSGSGSYSGAYYLWVRGSNDGGYDTAEDSVSADETASGGGGGFKAAWAHRRHQLIGSGVI